MRNTAYQMILAGSVSALALVVAGPALAQPQSTGLEEIVVTARRVSENLQDVPVSVTALTAEKLAEADIKDFFSAVRMVPGLKISGQPGSGSGLAWMRGVQGTVSYFADVPRAPVGFSALFDVNSLQVLKGPQGTLFGLASNAGAIVIDPKRPGEEFGGYLKGAAGSLDRRNLEAAANIPLAGGRVLLRLAGQTYYRRGHYVDISNGQDYGRQDYQILRPSAVVKITDTLENYTMYQYYHDRSIGTGGNSGIPYDYNFSPTAQLPVLGTQAARNGGTRAAFDALRDQILARQEQLGVYKFDGLSAGCPTDPNPTFGPGANPANTAAILTTLNYPTVACAQKEWAKDNQIVNTTTWSPSENLTIKNILGYQWGSFFNAGADQDSSRLVINDPNPRNNASRKADTTFSDELQATGKFRTLDFVAGIFHNQTQSHPQVLHSAYSLGPNNAASISKTSSYNWAGYAQGNLDLSSWVDGLSVTAGYRHSWNSQALLTYGLNATTLAVTSVRGGKGTPSGQAKFDTGTYTLGVQYKPSDRTLLYVTNSKGYSNGGLQNVVGYEVFEPDSLNNLEAGFKSTFEVGGILARVNASVYTGWFDDVKVSTRILQTNSATGVQSANVLTLNAATARIRGLEAESSFVLTPDLQVGGFLALSRARYTDYPSVNPTTLQPIDVSNTGFTNTPKVKFGVNANYRLPFSNEDVGDFYVNANFTRASKVMVNPRPKTRLDPTNPNTGFTCTRNRTTANGYGPLSADGKKIYIDCGPPEQQLDISFDWRNVFANPALRATLTVGNVTNEKLGAHVPTDSSLGLEAMNVPEPRLYTFSLAYQF